MRQGMPGPSCLCRTLLLVGPFPIGSTTYATLERMAGPDTRPPTALFQLSGRDTRCMVPVVAVAARRRSSPVTRHSSHRLYHLCPVDRTLQRVGKGRGRGLVRLTKNNTLTTIQSAKRRTGGITSQGLSSGCSYWSANMRSAFNTRHQPSHAHLTLGARLSKEFTAPRKYHCPRVPLVCAVALSTIEVAVSPSAPRETTSRPADNQPSKSAWHCIHRISRPGWRPHSHLFQPTTACLRHPKVC